jgi:hypothetical protein
LAPESVLLASGTLRLHDDGRARTKVEAVELKETTWYEVPLSPPLDGIIAVEVLTSQDRAMGQPAEKPKG